MKLPDPGFVALIDRLKKERGDQQALPPMPAKAQLIAITESGQVMPFRVWAKRWSDKYIDGR